MKNQQIVGGIFLWMATIIILLEPQPMRLRAEILIVVIAAFAIFLLLDWEEGKK